MSNQNMISGSNPINPVIAIPNLPSPQVISGTLGQQGMPPTINPPLNLMSFLETDLLSLTDLIGSFQITTDLNVGEELFSATLPFIYGPEFLPNQLDTNYLNWANFPLSSHMYYNPIQHIGFVVIAPEPVRGKILMVWDPTDVMGDAKLPHYDSKRRMITEEWDLADSKRFFRSFAPAGLVNQMPTDDQPQPRSPEIPAPSLVTPNYQTPAQFKNFGRLSLFVEQEIQVGSIFPKHYTVLVFGCFAGTKMSVPCDFRRSNYSNGGDSLLVAHENFLDIRENTFSKNSKNNLPNSSIGKLKNLKI